MIVSVNRWIRLQGTQGHPWPGGGLVGSWCVGTDAAGRAGPERDPWGLFEFSFILNKDEW